MVYFYVLCSKNILMKLVGYQQPTCLCVRIAFVVGTILLSCELYSLSWSCFRSCGIGMIVYEIVIRFTYAVLCRKLHG